MSFLTLAIDIFDIFVEWKNSNFYQFFKKTSFL